MKFKTDDFVWYDDNIGIVISGYPASDHKGFSYLVRWVWTRKQSEVWETDLLSDSEYRDLLDRSL